MKSDKPILIVGAGLAGCLMAAQLARLGYRVVVYEKRDAEEPPLLRSINLALSAATLELLRDEGLLPAKIKKITTPLHGRVLHTQDGRQIFQPYAATEAEATLLNPAAGAMSVARLDLNQLLRSSAAQCPNVEFNFRRRVLQCDPDTATLHVEDRLGKRSRVQGEIIIAADGARSIVRRLMSRRKPGLQEDLTQLRQAYKEITLQPNRRIRKNTFHIWPRSGLLLMALPNRDGTFRGGIFLPRRGKNSFVRVKGARALRQFFRLYFADAIESVPDLMRQWRKNPISPLVSLTCTPWHAARTVLIGDACHTLYPFSGQGANLALEDCVCLRECIEQFAPDWQSAFREFAEQRKPKVDFLCEATRAVSNLVLNALPHDGIGGLV